MKIKKTYLYRLLILCFSVFFTLIYTSLVFNNEIITDARNYFSFFKLIESSGFMFFIFDSYAASGKLELAYYSLYSIFSYFSIFDDFYYFVLINYIVIVSLTLYVLNKYAQFFSTALPSKVVLFSLLLAFTWFPSYLNMLWLWRADFAYSLVLLSYICYIKKKYTPFFIFSVLAFFSHYSSLPILTLLILFFVLSKNINKLSLGLKISATILISIIGAFIYKIIKSSFTSGEGNWVSDYYLGDLMLMYFFIGLAIITIIFYVKRQFFTEKNYYFILSVILFSLFSFVIALSSNGNHQDITRIMHVSFLLFCIIIPLIHQNGSMMHKAIIYLYASIGCAGTIYLANNFFATLN